MSPAADLAAATELLEDARENLYQLADQAPALSAPLSPAIIAITDVLSELQLGFGRRLDLRSTVLGATNLLATAEAGPLPEPVRLHLVAVRANLSSALQLLAPGPTTVRSYLRLVHSA